MKLKSGRERKRRAGPEKKRPVRKTEAPSESQ